MHTMDLFMNFIHSGTLAVRSLLTLAAWERTDRPAVAHLHEVIGAASGLSKMSRTANRKGICLAGGYVIVEMLVPLLRAGKTSSCRCPGGRPGWPELCSDGVADLDGL